MEDKDIIIIKWENGTPNYVIELDWNGKFYTQWKLLKVISTIPTDEEDIIDDMDLWSRGIFKDGFDVWAMETNDFRYSMDELDGLIKCLSILAVIATNEDKRIEHEVKS
jgi:hypothetical protein